MQEKYPWAVNLVKLAKAIKSLEAKKKLDAKFEITEEAIKREYIRFAGLLARFKPQFVKQPDGKMKIVRPEVTDEEMAKEFSAPAEQTESAPEKTKKTKKGEVAPE